MAIHTIKRIDIWVPTYSRYEDRVSDRHMLADVEAIDGQITLIHEEARSTVPYIVKFDLNDIKEVLGL
jgi:hypothetical protein